jgi:hypothetical protein
VVISSHRRPCVVYHLSWVYQTNPPNKHLDTTEKRLLPLAPLKRVSRGQFSGSRESGGGYIDKPHGLLRRVWLTLTMSRFRYHHLGAILASSRLHSMAGGALKGDDGPLLPVSNRLDSFWLKERDPILRNARTTTDLPKTADVVIVGSGLTGAMSAYHLQRAANAKGRKLKIVMLEADECCGSATARNGECRPSPKLSQARWAL